MLMALKLCAGSSADLARNAHVRFTQLGRIGPLHAGIDPRSQPGTLLHRRFRLLRFRAPAARDIFLTVDRRHMRRISTEIRPPDSKLRAVFIDPFADNQQLDQATLPRSSIGASKTVAALTKRFLSGSDFKLTHYLRNGALSVGGLFHSPPLRHGIAADDRRSIPPSQDCQNGRLQDHGLMPVGRWLLPN
jgi:hypothetical protein